MGQKTRVSVALLGALAMFFIGGNIPLIASLLGLTRRSSFSSHAGASSTAHIVDGAAQPTAKPLSKKAAAAAALKAVLVDDERALCSTRYPNSLTVTEEQDDYLTDQRYFIVITLRNNEDMLYHALYELLGVIARLGPRNVFISVFENNSKDKTPQFLALFSDVLKLVGVAHNLVSTFTLQRELAAMREVTEKLADSASLGRRLKEDADAAEKIWYQDAVKGALAAQAAGEVSGEHEWWPAEEEETRDERNATDRFSRAKGLIASWRKAGACEEAAAPADALGRRLGESMAVQRAKEADAKVASITAAAAKVADDIALLTGAKWEGNRIEFLARVRNRSIKPLFTQKETYDRVIIMNDAFWCAEDVIRLALHKDADVACGLDFDTTNSYGVGFYDTWVTRDINGEPFRKNSPFTPRPEDWDRARLGLPFHVYCCWNGLLVANAAPFYEGVRFRRGIPGECATSECQLFCKDFWRKGAGNFVLDPHVRVAYDLPTYENLHKPNWMEGSSKFLTKPDSVQWPEDIPWATRGPERVLCCGLEGNGRDPDVPCFHEETLIPQI